MAKEKVFKPNSILRPNLAVLERVELPGDTLLFLYFAVLTRQYFWWLTSNNRIAWVASLLVAAVISWLFLATKERGERDGAGLPFWLVAIVPLVFVYALRVVFPDMSFDVLNYRLLHGERALSGFIYLPGDFFPTPAPYNPAPDMVTGVFRHALGYRLGTVANLLAMIWVARITDKLLRPFLTQAWLRAAGVLLAVMAEHLLFEINNYMADLLALPLLLEATYLALRHEEWGDRRRNLVCIALLLGMSVAFKLTNAAAALPVVLLCGYWAITGRPTGKKKITQARELALATLLCAAAFLLPLAPFSVYLYRLTGSFVFPVFNGLFKSVYWPAHSIWDPRWGPSNLWEKLAWPLIISFKPERLSELAVYSGRISLGFAAAILGLFLAKRDGRLRLLCLITLASALLWSASTGYIRYAFYVEVLAAIVVLALAARLASLVQTQTPDAGLLVARLLWLVLVFQTCLAGYYVSKHEWSGRPTLFRQPGPYRREVRYLLRDHSLRDFLSQDAREKFDAVEAWIVSSIKTSSLQMMLQPRAPLLGIKTPEYFVTARSREQFYQALKNASGKRMFSLAFAEDLETAKTTLRRRGLNAKEAVPLEIPTYSQRAFVTMFLIEVDYDPFYLAEISVVSQPASMEPGANAILHVKVRNASKSVWPSHAAGGRTNVVTVGNRWLRADLEVFNDMDGRARLPRDFGPGEEADLTLRVTAPTMEGDYILEIDMVDEGVTWFNDRGSPTLKWPVKVVRNRQ